MAKDKKGKPFVNPGSQSAGPGPVSSPAPAQKPPTGAPPKPQGGTAPKA